MERGLAKDTKTWGGRELEHQLRAERPPWHSEGGGTPAC